MEGIDMKLKMRTKIRGGLLLVFLISMLVGIYAAFAVARITDYIAQMEELTQASNQASAMVKAHHLWISNITESFMFGTSFTGGLDPRNCVWGQWRYSDQIYVIDDPAIMELIRSIDHPHARLHLDGAEALRLRADGRYEEAFALLQNVVLPYGYISINSITALNDRYIELWSDVREDLRLVGGEVMRTVTVIFSLALVAFLISSYVIPKNILKPVRHLMTIVSDVSHGNLNVNIDMTNVSKDEIGVLTQDVCDLVDVIKSMVQDLTDVSEIYNVQGKMDFRLNTSKYHNSFNDMVRGINNILDRETDNIRDIVDIFNQIGNGNFNVKVRNLQGDFIILSDAIHAVTDNLKDVNTEVTAMIKAAINGDLSFKTDDTKYKGDWQKIMVGLNDIAKAVDEPLKTVVVAMDEIKAGNFDLQKINKSLTEKGFSTDSTNYKGAFKSILNAFDEAITEIYSYINEVSGDLEAISSGDLTTEITREYLGNFAAIKNSLNHISSSLHKTMSEISISAQQVLIGANQISSSAIDLASSAQEQASYVQELNAAVDLINQQTGQNAKSALTANELSNKSAANAQEGNVAMEQTMEAMTEIKESSNNISKIIKSIQDIAFQTNLLALNASVEAARAGEHGKGFSVVADEVRTLAGRSQEAANETTTLIHESIERVEIGSNIAETTSKSLNAIVVSSGEVSGIINDISTASSEQADAVAQVSEGLAQISKVTQSNSTVSEETAAAAEELNSQAETLQQLVAFFKL